MRSGTEADPKKETSACPHVPVDQFRQPRAVVSAHDPGADARGENVPERLTQVVDAGQGLSSLSVHAEHGGTPEVGNRNKKPRSGRGFLCEVLCELF